MTSPPRNYPRAALLALITFSGWTLSDALLKLVRAQALPQGEILLVSGLSGMAVIFILSALRGQIARLQPHKGFGLLALGLCQLAGFLFWMAALPRLPLTNMYVVSFLTPMTVAGLAALILKEHLGWRRAVLIAAGFAGVVVAMNPASLGQKTGAFWPYLAVFGSMATTAAQMLLLRGVGRHESGESMSFYPRAVIVAVGAASCALTGFVAMKPWVFLSLCASGALGSLGWAILAQAYKDAPAAAVAPFQYSQMLSGALLGYLIWNDVPDAYLLGGAAIIIVSGIGLVRHERRVSRMLIRAE